jgi:hypothetical protein
VIFVLLGLMALLLALCVAAMVWPALKPSPDDKWEVPPPNSHWQCSETGRIWRVVASGPLDPKSPESIVILDSDYPSKKRLTLSAHRFNVKGESGRRYRRLFVSD